MLGDTVAIGIYSRTFDLARIEASVDEETCIQDCVPEEAEGWTYLCMGKNTVPYTDIVKLRSIVHVIRSKTVSHEQVIQTLLKDGGF